MFLKCPSSVYHKVTFISVKGCRREGNANRRGPIVDSQEKKKSKSQTEMDRRRRQIRSRQLMRTLK